jgi:small subunit ribosomal protein S6
MPIRPYEVVYIIDPDVSADDTTAVVERFRALAEGRGAQELRVDTHTLGRRRLAYEIDHKREGQYVVMNFQSEADAPAEVERVLKITDTILRSMVIRLEEMPPEPAAPPAPEAPQAQEAQPEPADVPEDAEPAEAAAPEAESTQPEAEAAEAPEPAADATESPAPDEAEPVAETTEPEAE